MTIDHDLATTLRELATLQRWRDHCTRDARSPLGALQPPQGDAEAPRVPADDDAGRDTDWRAARALERLLVTLSPASQRLLLAVADTCPPGTAAADCARRGAREVVRDEGDGSDPTVRAWRVLETAETRAVAARVRLDAARGLAAVGRRRRAVVDARAAAEATAAAQALAAAEASRADALAAWTARGLALLAVAVGEWRAARRSARLATAA